MSLNEVKEAKGLERIRSSMKKNAEDIIKPIKGTLTKTVKITIGLTIIGLGTSVVFFTSKKLRRRLLKPFKRAEEITNEPHRLGGEKN